MGEIDLSPYNSLGQPNAEVVFSLVDDFVWVSWPGTMPMVRLGRYETVTAMMQDFIAQSELGERLANGKAAI